MPRQPLSSSPPLAACRERLARGEPAAREERPREERPPAERERGEVEEGERRGERYERRDSRGAGDHRPDRERSDRGRSSDYRSRDRSKSRSAHSTLPCSQPAAAGR